MKQIKIIGKQGQHLNLTDNDNENIESYTKKITSLFETKNIVILHTTSSSIVVRPSDIFAVEVESIFVPDNEVQTIPGHISEETKQIQEDTLTD